MLVRNVLSKRDLREGDVVRIQSGRKATVVGISVLEAEAIVTMDADGDVRMSAANEVEFVHDGPAGLEPLPSVVSELTEGRIKKGVTFCGDSVCLVLSETNQVLTLTAKNPNSNLKEVFDRSSRNGTFENAVLETMREAYVTRLPHLCDSELTRKIDALLGENVETSVTTLEDLTE